MSLIRIRGRTILSPILNEEQRAEARALREKAVLYQRRLQELRNNQLHQCNYEYQQQQQKSRFSFHHQKTQTETSEDGLDNYKSFIKHNKNFNKNEATQTSITNSKKRSCQETSSSSAPSSQGSGGELTSEGLEDSPSAANVSVQTESSESVATSTDLHPYLNNSHDNSLNDTSVSVSHDIWRNSPSLTEVDEALLQTDSPEVATSLILGRLHPSAVLNAPKPSRQESQNTETTSSTLIQGQQSSGKQGISDGQDTSTMASITLSFASVSEGSEEGALEESEDLLDVYEEDKCTSFPSDLEADVPRFERGDSHKYSPKRQLQEKAKASLKNAIEAELEEGLKSSKENCKNKTAGLQHDSGRGTSHSDYLDNYLEILTNRSGSSHGVLPVTTSSLSSHEVTLTTTFTNSDEGLPIQKMPNVTSPINSVKTDPSVTSAETIETSPEDTFGRTYTISKDDSLPHSGQTCEQLASRNENQNKEGSVEVNKENDSTADEIEDFSSIENDWQKELLLKPRASSATPERKERKRSRPRRWSSCQPLDPRRSVGSKYLDSYLGKLTDDAWLQYPTQLSDRRMIYLSSDEYINAIRPKPAQKPSDQHFTSTDMSETSASEENKNLHTSSESLHSSIPESTVRETYADKNQNFPLVGKCVIEEAALKNTVTQMEVPGNYMQEMIVVNIENKPYENIDNLSLENPAMSLSSTSLPKERVKVDNIDFREEMTVAVMSTKKMDGIMSKSASLVMPRSHSMSLEADSSVSKHGKACTNRMTSSMNDMKIDVHYPIEDVILKSRDGISNFDHQKHAKFANMYGSFTSNDEIRVTKLSCKEDEEEDGHETSSEASSETEPSTIVYVEDFQPESPVEAKTLLSTESEEQSFLVAEKSVAGTVENNSIYSASCATKLLKKEVSLNGTEALEAFSKAAIEQSNLIDHSIQLVSSQKLNKIKPEKDLNYENEYGTREIKQRSYEYVTEGSDEETLVVQVTVNKGKSPDIHKPVTSITVTEPIDSNESPKGAKCNMNLNLKEIEYSQEKLGCSLDVFPEHISKDAMGQVLSLLKAKQQQELEELKVRQEKETHHIIEKLQRVSPQQLQSFLTVSTVNERRASPVSRGHDRVVTNQSSPNKSAAESNSFSERLDVKRPARTVSPLRYAENHPIVVTSEDEMKGGKTLCENKYQITVPCNAYQDVASGECVLPSSHSHTDFVNCTDSQPSSLAGSSHRDHSPRIPNTTYLASSMSLSSESMFSSAHSAAPPDSLSSSMDRRVESPKPRPSNHTNIMPSYFRYEENTISAKVEKYDDYKTHSIEQQSSYVESDSRPQSLPQSASSLSNSGYSVICCSAHMKNNNPETVDAISYINGNCLSYGDGKQYYRLFTGDDECTTTSTTKDSSQVVSYQPRTTETVMQPGLFRIIGNGSRPTSITSLLQEHPDMFGEEVIEVNLQHESDWAPARTENHEQHVHPAPLHQPMAAAAETERGLDMVPERDNAPSHRLSENWIFIRGITKLQANVRRFLTQRLLRTKFVQEQLSTLSEIAKLAQQFHRDILTDNIQKGDVDFHKTLYNQERIARERIRRVFVVLNVQEQMALLHRDQQLCQIEQERKRSSENRTSPAHTRKIRNVDSRPQHSTIPTKTGKKTSPPGPRLQLESKTRPVSSSNKVSALVQPALVHQPQSYHQTRGAVRPDYRLSPRGSRLPVHVPRSSSNLEQGTHSHYSRSATQSTRSPSQDSRSSLSSSSRSGSQPPKSNSTSLLCGRNNSQQSPRSTGGRGGAANAAGTTRTCTIKNPTNR
ncbi:hypothetical protein SK128_028148, partial [Halocaridina rubra]